VQAILIPVKDLTQAKQRLASLIPQKTRTRLARAMLDDVFAAVAGMKSRVPVFVVSSDAEALAAARALGWECLPETEQHSESRSVDAASRICAERGITGLLRLPIDIPLVRAEDIDALLAACPAAPSAVLVPSRTASGTNALLRTPPGLFRSHFGPGSMQKHLDEACRLRAHTLILRNPRIEFDVDDVPDIRHLASRNDVGAHTTAALQELNLRRRAAHS